MSLRDLFSKKTKKSIEADAAESAEGTNDELDPSGDELPVPIKEGAALSQAIPLSVVIGFLPGSKAKDADSYVRGLMGKVVNDLNISGYNVMRFRGGYAYEIQEGGEGESWLRSVLSLLDEKRVIVIPAASRYIKIELEETSIHCSLLREGDPLEQEVVIPTRNGKLKAFHNYVQKWVSTSVTMAIFSLMLFLMVLFGQKMLSEQSAEKMVVENMSKTQILPILYWPEVMAEDLYVAKLEFVNGAWKPPVFKSFNAIDPESAPTPVLRPTPVVQAPQVAKPSTAIVNSPVTATQ